MLQTLLNTGKTGIQKSLTPLLKRALKILPNFMIDGLPAETKDGWLKSKSSSGKMKMFLSLWVQATW